MSTSDLTQGEKLYLWRHRQLSPRKTRRKGRCGPAMSQAEAAEMLGVGLKVYRQAERDAAAPSDLHHLVEKTVGSSEVIPSAGEALTLARRRLHLSLFRAAEELGVSLPTYHAWERSADPRARGMLEGHGAIF